MVSQFWQSGQSQATWHGIETIKGISVKAKIIDLMFSLYYFGCALHHSDNKGSLAMKLNRQKLVLLSLCLLAAMPITASAGRITMSNPDEQELAGGKLLCVYSNSIYTFTIVTRSTSCPYTRTFDTEDSE